MDKPYHHGDLRSALLAALDEAVREVGPEAASTRAVARKVGVAPSAVFRHFRDRRALLTAYAAEGFVQVASSVEAAAPEVRDMAAAYLDFAFSHPGQFRTMFCVDLLDPDDRALARGQDALSAALGIWRTDIGARATDVPLVLYAAMHGFAALALDTPFGDRLPDDLVERRGAILTMLRRLTAL